MKLQDVKDHVCIRIITHKRLVYNIIIKCNFLEKRNKTAQRSLEKFFQNCFLVIDDNLIFLFNFNEFYLSFSFSQHQMATHTTIIGTERRACKIGG